MEQIKTKSGKTFKADYFTVIQTPARAYIRVLAPLPEVAAVFSDPGETAQMWFGSEYLANFTNLKALIPEGNAIKVCLAKE